MSESSETKVVAAMSIATGSRSRPFSLSEVSEVINFNNIKFPLQVSLAQNGELEVCENFARGKKRNGAGAEIVTWFWIKCIQFATDCHVQNVRICKWQTDAVILQVTKEIGAGDELLLWFGEDVLVNDLGIPPYLNPNNIRGGKSYRCHKCQAEFEAPNPLKVHLALSCGAQPIDDLWSRMATPRVMTPPSLNLRIAPPTLRVVPPNFRIAPPSFTVGRDPPSFFFGSTATTGSTASLAIASVPFSAQISNSTTTKVQGHQRLNSLTSASGLSQLTSLVTTTQVKSLSDQQAQLETIMSNMGRGKNGSHVCVYCGKLYSRKYGLKIHIRTHTGFKPLQCKICHRPFGDPSNLNKHVRLHADGNTPYRCEICTKVLVRRRDLDRHIRSRHSTLALELPPQQSAIDCSIRQSNIPSETNIETTSTQ